MNSLITPGISAISVYLPKNILGNIEIIERFGFKPDFLLRKLGIENRHVAETNESVSDMAVKAGQQLLSELNLDTGSIELIVLCTQNPDYFIPSTINIIQNRLELSNNVAAFEINQGCSGYIYSLALVKSLMIAEEFNRAILITSEAYSKVIDPNDRYTVPIFGDGATATLVESGGIGKINKFTYGSDGSGFDKLIVKGGGSRYPEKKREGDGALYMNGAGIFKFMMTKIPMNIAKCLEINGFSMDDIDFFIFHQASRYMIESLATSLNISMDKVPISLKNTGNTVSSSIPITLNQLIDSKNLKNKKILLSGFGAGLSWATTLITF